MKKTVLFFLILGIGLLCGCRSANAHIYPADSIEPPSNIYIGMQKEEFRMLYPEESCFYYWHNYAFFEDDEGNPVVVAFEEDGSYNSTIIAIHAYDKNGIKPIKHSMRWNAVCPCMRSLRSWAIRFQF